MADTNFSLMIGIGILVQCLGVLNAAHAIMNVRLPQSALAWSLSLVLFPWISMPLYWVLGRRKFKGYETAYREAYREYRAGATAAFQQVLVHEVPPAEYSTVLYRLAKKLVEIPFTGGNQAYLLRNGDQTYDAIIAAIDAAEQYILFQFYIINDDAAGQRFLQALSAKVQQGVRVYILYDEIGSRLMTKSFLQTCRSNGIEVSSFRTTQGVGNRFQLNFRNHRKIVVIDGQIGFVGGLNIGDEYQGKSKKFGPWRDTHMQINGPATKALQLTFLKDWYWATREIPQVQWTSVPVANGQEHILVLPTSPADRQQTCTMFVDTAINLAQSRLWIASPYFVPDEPTLSALKTAVLRGVDVRILLPGHPDHLLVYLCSFSYYSELQTAGIRLYRYHTGFMHQKVILVDDVLAGVGTVNLDNRSFLLNFEVMAYVTQGEFVRHVEAMLKDDLTNSVCVDLTEYDRRSWLSKLAIQSARLAAPLQ
jgi:cardiolipin synthase